MMLMTLQIDSYSAFYDNGHMTQTELHDVLTERNIATLYIVGLAIDFCVYYTAVDANTLGLASKQILLTALAGVVSNISTVPNNSHLHLAHA